MDCYNKEEELQKPVEEMIFRLVYTKRRLGAAMNMIVHFIFLFF